MARRTPLIVALAAALALLGTSLAGAGKPKNGGFEKGDFSRWQIDSEGEGQWLVYSGDPFAARPAARGVPEGSNFPPPPRGEFAAMTRSNNPASNVLHRVLRLKEDKKHKLSFLTYYDNTPGTFFTPDNLDHTGGPNQQYRVDVMRRGADLRSVDDSDVLKPVFQTEVGDPAELGVTKIKTKLTRFAGKRVRLRFAEVDNQEPFYVGVDAVKLKSKPKK